MVAKAKVWTKEEILTLLEKSDAMVRLSLLKLYARQTRDEQISMCASRSNHVGFNQFDARLLSSFSEYCKRYRKLTPKQTDATRKMLRKYVGQITKIANEGA